MLEKCLLGWYFEDYVSITSEASTGVAPIAVNANGNYFVITILLLVWLVWLFCNVNDIILLNTFGDSRTTKPSLRVNIHYKSHFLKPILNMKLA